MEPTSQPSHPVATFKPSGRSPIWVAVTITCSTALLLAQVQCLVSVIIVFLWWRRTVCSHFAAGVYTRELGVGCPGISCLAAQRSVSAPRITWTS